MAGVLHQTRPHMLKPACPSLGVASVSRPVAMLAAVSTGVSISQSGVAGASLLATRPHFRSARINAIPAAVPPSTPPFEGPGVPSTVSGDGGPSVNDQIRNLQDFFDRLNRDSTKKEFEILGQGDSQKAKAPDPPKGPKVMDKMKEGLKKIPKPDPPGLPGTLVKIFRFVVDPTKKGAVVVAVAVFLDRLKRALDKKSTLGGFLKEIITGEPQGEDSDLREKIEGKTLGHVVEAMERMIGILEWKDP